MDRQRACAVGCVITLAALFSRPVHRVVWCKAHMVFSLDWALTECVKLHRLPVTLCCMAVQAMWWDQMLDPAQFQAPSVLGVLDLKYTLGVLGGPETIKFLHKSVCWDLLADPVPFQALCISCTWVKVHESTRQPKTISLCTVVRTNGWQCQANYNVLDPWKVLGRPKIMVCSMICSQRKRLEDQRQ